MSRKHVTVNYIKSIKDSNTLFRSSATMLTELGTTLLSLGNQEGHRMPLYRLKMLGGKKLLTKEEYMNRRWGGEIMYK